MAFICSMAQVPLVFARGWLHVQPEQIWLLHRPGKLRGYPTFRCLSSTSVQRPSRPPKPSTDVLAEAGVSIPEPAIHTVIRRIDTSRYPRAPAKSSRPRKFTAASLMAWFLLRVSRSAVRRGAALLASCSFHVVSRTLNNISSGSPSMGVAGSAKILFVRGRQ